MTRRWLAVVNPAAGRPGHAEACGRSLLADGTVARVERTRGPGDAARIVREADDVDGVVAVGGDGTIHEILAGLDATGRSLAVMPVGHGNCLARDLGVGTLALARQALACGAPRPIDLLAVTLDGRNGHPPRVYAACTVAIGYVADVVARGRVQLGWLGTASYTAASLATRPRRVAASTHLDGAAIATPRCTGLIVNNTAHLANFRVFPEARLDDGRLEVMGLAAGWPRQVAHNASILAGSRLVPPAFLEQGREVHLALDEPGTVMIDGELYPGHADATIRVVPAACICVGRS